MGTKFEVGKTYSYFFCCDSSSSHHVKVTKRTKCFVYLQAVHYNHLDGREPAKRRKIWINSDGNESVSLGSYSMAPVVYSTPVEPLFEVHDPTIGV